MPYDDYAKSLRVLDDARLNKQRSEVKAVVVMCLSPQFATQPIVRMWRDHLWWLLEYGRLSCLEQLSRGFKDNLRPYFEFHQRGVVRGTRPVFPESYHSSVRANLLRKDPRYYRRYGWTEQPMEGYLWPS